MDATRSAPTAGLKMPASTFPSEVVSTIDRLFAWAKGYH